MSKLYFRLGSMEGFTAGSMADKKEGYANPIRELLQNSLDASREAGNDQCEINIYIEEIPLREIPNLDDYKRVLELAIQTAKTRSSFNKNSQRRVEMIENTLGQKSVKIMMFSDNGIGMSKDGLEAILTGYSRKGADDEKATGSFGVGHLSSYSLSSLRYILYATKHQGCNGNTQTLFTGQPILAGHRDRDGAQRGSAGRIVMRKPQQEDDPAFEYPATVPDFIAPKIDALDNGTIVIVLGLSENWNDDAEYAIVSNFFHAIAHDALSITVHQNGNQKTISTDEVERLISLKEMSQHATGGRILSGKSVHQAWHTVKEDDTQKTIELSNSDVVYVCIQSDKNANPTIILVRNGMVVARHDHMLSDHMDDLRKNQDFMPFTAVIDVDQEKAPELFRLVKGAETPYHDKLQKKILNSADEKCLKSLLEELSEKIKDHLIEITRDSFVVPLFFAPGKAEEQDEGSGKTRGQTTRAKPQKDKPKRRKPQKRNGRNGEKRKKPVVVSRDLKAKSAVRYTDAGGEWRVAIRVTPESVDDRDHVYLSICLGEDNDNDQPQSYLDFTAVELDGIAIELDGPEKTPVKNASQADLGRWKRDRSYNIIATVKKPDHIGDMKVALLPILGLKRKLATKEE